MIVCSFTMGLSGQPRLNFEEFRGAGKIDDSDAQARQRHLNKKIQEFKMFLASLHDCHGMPPTKEDIMELRPTENASTTSREPDELLTRIEGATETVEILLLCQEMLNLTRIRIGDCIKKIEKTIEREKQARKPGILKSAWKYVFGKTEEDIHPLESTLLALQLLEGQTADYVQALHNSMHVLPDNSKHRINEMFLLECKNTVKTFKELRLKSGIYLQAALPDAYES